MAEGNQEENSREVSRQVSICSLGESVEQTTRKVGETRRRERRNVATHPRPTAEMNVPANANVRMTPKFLKKFSCSVQERSRQCALERASDLRS